MSGGPITLTLPMPPSVNELHGKGRGRVYTSKVYANWQVVAGWECHVQRSDADEPYGLTGRYTVRLTLSSDGRRGDADNRMKATLDLLVRLGITPDDRFCESATAEWGEAPKGQCIVRIAPVARQEAA